MAVKIKSPITPTTEALRADLKSVALEYFCALPFDESKWTLEHARVASLAKTIQDLIGK